MLNACNGSLLFLAFAVDHLIIVRREIAGVSLHVRHDLLFCDVDRHVPVWPEDQILHMVGDHGRVVLVLAGLAVHHAHAESLVIALKGTQFKFGQVHQDRGLLVLVIEPAPAFHRIADFRGAGAHGRVQRDHCVMRELSVLRQAMAVLKVLQSFGQLSQIRRRTLQGLLCVGGRCRRCLICGVAGTRCRSRQVAHEPKLLC